MHEDAWRRRRGEHKEMERGDLQHISCKYTNECNQCAWINHINNTVLIQSVDVNNKLLSPPAWIWSLVSGLVRSRCHSFPSAGDQRGTQHLIRHNNMFMSAWRCVWVFFLPLWVKAGVQLCPEDPSNMPLLTEPRCKRAAPGERSDSSGGLFPEMPPDPRCG